MPRRFFRLAATAVIGLSVLPAVAQADVTIAVNNTTDETTANDTKCSLREAIQYVNTPGTANDCAGANASPGTITINLPTGVNLLTVAPGELDVTGAAPVIINGQGDSSSGSVISAGGSTTTITSRIFNIASTSTVTLNNIEVTGGAAPLDGSTTGGQSGLNGGAILNSGKLTVNTDFFTNNQTASGALCAAGCSASAPTSLNTGNGGSGGAIYNNGGATLTVTNSTFTHNTAGGGGSAGGGANGPNGANGSPGGSAGSGGSGGAIYSSGTLTISGSTFSSNAAGAGGNAGSGGSSFFPIFCVIAAITCNGGNGGAAGAAGNAGAGGAIFSSWSGSGLTSAGVGPSSGKGLLTISNTTISGNSTGDGGAGGDGGNGTSGVNGGSSGSGSTGSSGGSADKGSPFAAGGGIVADSPNPQATNSITTTTISGNKTGTGGVGGNAGTGPAGNGTAGNGGNGGNAGGLEVGDSTGANPILNLTNSTIAGNSTGSGAAAGTGGTNTPSAGSAGNGGGSEIETFAQLNLVQSTVASNTSSGLGAGVYGSQNSVVHFDRALIAANSSSAAGVLPKGDCGANVANGNAYTDDGHTIFAGDTNGCPAGGAGSQTVADAKIGTLGNNGGPEQTVALKTGSVAIDNVPTNNCPNTDERGLIRPQGGACDSGAYEYAPPTISSNSSAVGSTTTATINASINPNLSSAHTTVVVNYGTSSSYGSTTSSQDLGGGSTPVAYSQALTGLTPGTTYHYDIVATNADGSTSTSDGTFTTVASQTPSEGQGVTSGSMLTVSVTCNGGDPNSVCSGNILATSHVTTVGKVATAVAASVDRKKKKKRKPKPKPKPVTTVVTVGSGSYSVATGKTETVTLALNKAGLALLRQFYRLPATITFTGAVTSTQTVTFVYPKITSVFSYLANDNGTDTFSQLTVLGGVPQGASVLMKCAKGGCSPTHTVFKLKGNNIAKSSKPFLKLRPGASAYLEIIKPNFVGKVLMITNPGHGSEKDKVLCLPPGTSKPSKCAK